MFICKTCSLHFCRVFQSAKGTVDTLGWTQRNSLLHHQKVIEIVWVSSQFCCNNLIIFPKVLVPPQHSLSLYHLKTWSQWYFAETWAPVIYPVLFLDLACLLQQRDGKKPGEQLVLTVQICKYAFSKATLCGPCHHTFIMCFGSLKCSCTWCPVEKTQVKPVARAGCLDQCLKCLDRFGVWIERTERGELFSIRAYAASTKHT